MKLLDLLSENEVKEAVLGEYEKKLVLYKLTDEMFKRKYGMGLDEFESKDIVAQKDHSWDVEKDAMEWEHAVEGMRHVQEKIDKIKESNG